MAKRIVVHTVADATEQEQASQVAEQEQAQEQAQTTQEQEQASQVADNDATVDTEQVHTVITLAQINAYTPDAIDAALSELEQKHNTVNMLVGKMPDETVTATREALGITSNLEADKESTIAKLGGRVALVYDLLKQDDGETWNSVAEYTDLIALVDEINDTRAKLGLPILSVKLGGRVKGSAATVDASISPRRTSGYMKPGTIEGEYNKGSKIKWVATLENILVTVDGRKVYTGKQGETSLSVIHNEKVLPATGASGRSSFPKWLRDNGYMDVDSIMLHAAPTVTVEK